MGRPRPFLGHYIDEDGDWQDCQEKIHCDCPGV